MSREVLGVFEDVKREHASLAKALLSEVGLFFGGPVGEEAGVGGGNALANNLVQVIEEGNPKQLARAITI